jgi:uncharacterized protein (UPF0335 family)
MELNLENFSDLKIAKETLQQLLVTIEELEEEIKLLKETHNKIYDV